MTGPYSLRYRPGTALAERWGDGPTGSFNTREEAEWVRIHCRNGDDMEVVSDDAK